VKYLDNKYVSPWIGNGNTMPLIRYYLGSSDLISIDATGEEHMKYKIGNVYFIDLMDAIRYADDKLKTNGVCFLTQEEWDKYQILI